MPRGIKRLQSSQAIIVTFEASLQLGCQEALKRNLNCLLKEAVLYKSSL